MEIIAKILILFCLVASSLCNPVNFTGNIVECQIYPESKARKYLDDNTVESRGTRIVYGNLAAANQFPYYGYTVLYRSQSTTLCGSSLISTRWLVSAAHCLMNVIGGQVYFGSVDNKALTVSQAISAYTSHAGWNPSNLANDISLIKLYAPVPLSLSIQTIKLPVRSQMTRDFAGVNLLVAGFGKTSTGSLPRYLQYTSITGLTFDECLSAHWVYTNLMVCGKSAFTYGSSICQGDSGGPLAERGSSVSVLIGVSSYSQTTTCINDIQGFTRVDKYLDWISYYTGIYINNN